jgi:penicillin-insensitive murein endopeptidase
MLELQPKDTRGYFMLPQAPEDAGYYVYGTPGDGAGQFGHPALMSVLFFVEREWQAIDARKFGIGNISKAGGGKYGKHSSHKDGLQVDIRALRIDGRQLPVTRFQREYDHEATAKLIDLFFLHPSVKNILFNDSDIPGVQHWVDHDDHFHVDIRAVLR